MSNNDSTRGLDSKAAHDLIDRFLRALGPEKSREVLQGHLQAQVEAVKEQPRTRANFQRTSRLFRTRYVAIHGEFPADNVGMATEGSRSPEEEAAWVRRMVALEEERGEFPPGGFAGGVVPLARARARASADALLEEAFSDSTPIVEQPTPEPPSPDDLAALAEADEQRTKAEKEVIGAISRRADELLEGFTKASGKALNRAPVLETIHGRPIVFILSYTLTTPKLTIKHDIKVNGKAAIIKHPKMVRLPNGDHLLRSYPHTDVSLGRSSVKYVKALHAEDGMFFFGYYEIDGKQQDQCSEFFQLIKGVLTTITEASYRAAQNRMQMGESPLPPAN